MEASSRESIPSLFQLPVAPTLLGLGPPLWLQGQGVFQSGAQDVLPFTVVILEGVMASHCGLLKIGVKHI